MGSSGDRQQYRGWARSRGNKTGSFEKQYTLSSMQERRQSLSESLGLFSASHAASAASSSLLSGGGSGFDSIRTEEAAGTV